MIEFISMVYLFISSLIAFMSQNLAELLRQDKKTGHI
jgi:hypothetical protein